MIRTKRVKKGLPLFLALLIVLTQFSSNVSTAVAQEEETSAVVMKGITLLGGDKQPVENNIVKKEEALNVDISIGVLENLVEEETIITIPEQLKIKEMEEKIVSDDTIIGSYHVKKQELIIKVFVVEKEAETTITLPVVYTPENEDSKREELQKVDEFDKAVQGVEFDLLDKDKNVITPGLLTDAAGKINIPELAPGTYFLEEIKALDDYILNTKPVEFQIVDEADREPKVVEVKFINYQGSASLTKMNQEKVPLPGAEFKVVAQDGTVIKERIVSDKDGVLFINKLAPGTYQFAEIKAPEGYQFSNRVVKFTIEPTVAGEYETLKLGEFVNEKIPKVPEEKPTPKPDTSGPGGKVATGDNRNIIIYIILLAVAVAGGIFVVWKKKKNKK